VLEVLWTLIELVAVRDCDEIVVSVEELDDFEEVEDTEELLETTGLS
jgi:hypothetical protein